MPTNAIHFMKQAALAAHARLLKIGFENFMTEYGHLFHLYVYDKVFYLFNPLEFTKGIWPLSVIFKEWEEVLKNF